MTNKVRVIIADDHEAVRSGVAAILGTDPGFEIVAEAENGFDALAVCIRHAPDVALVDLRMPGTDGIWATERITAETTTRVIVLTTYDSDDLIARALTSGARGYLLKSTSGAELIQAVHHVAADRHVIDPAIAGGVIARLTAARHAGHGAEDAPMLDPSQLTSRERQVFDLLTTGMTNQAIAERLGVGITTVKTHVGALYAKTGADSRVQLARLGAV
ncbi:response regulator [Microbacterium sp. A93]|uniref:response regulator n=1 Tax=unclassified Microbacterium TaxID=2609290 RepID=UPI003F437D11